MTRRKISKATRAEAIEITGARATFWAGGGHYPDVNWSEEARILARHAYQAAGNHDDMGEEPGALMYAEAQAMLLEGWEP